LADAVSKLPAELPKVPEPVPARFDPAFYDPQHALVDEIAAVNVGIVDKEIRLDLDYWDDSRATVDMNIAYTAAGRFVEVQGSAENGGGFDRSQMQTMMDLAVSGCGQLIEKIRAIRRSS
jgi:ribonuclease PH